MGLDSRVVPGEGYVDLVIYVKPRSKYTKLTLEGDDLVFHTTEPPVSGRANESLIKYLSRLLRVPKSNIAIVQGLKNKVKKVRVHGVSTDVVLGKLKQGNHP
ncbi:MAG: DUF167 domain-containing protein [Desulfurococcales archaeon]|nr:DUF167 domain-containing protein [Desulfurococcales archaeon]